MRLESFHKKNLVKAKKIIADSVMYQLVPQVSSLKTSMRFDSLNKLFEGEDPECRDHAVIRVSQIKEQLEAEVVIATLNSLPGSWDSFMQGMCAIRK